MICPKCREDGLKSWVYPQGGMATAMYCPPYFDEEGRYHIHDYNTSEYFYSCSMGHDWVESSRGSCWCGWEG